MKRARRLDLIPPYLFSELARTKEKALAEGKDLIDFGIGDPDQPTPEFVIEALARHAADPATHRYDETKNGIPEFCRAAAGWYKRRFAVELDPDGQVLSLIGSKEGLAHLAWAILDPGDLVLVPDPAYTVYRAASLLCGAEPFAMPLLRKNGFLPDLGSVPNDVAHRAKLMFLCYPNNPTSAVADIGFFERAVEFARANDIMICHDCAYSEVNWLKERPPSILQAEGAADVAIEIHSLSKTFNMTGWRIAFAVGNPDAVSALRTLKTNVDSKQFAAIQLAAADSLNYDGNLIAESIALYRRRKRILVEGLNRLGCPAQDTGATFYVWAPLPDGSGSIEFAGELLEKAGILATPGVAYGDHGEGFLRFSVTVEGDKNGERVAEAIERMESAESLRWGQAAA
jgi:LL-diaminopimelate aminotransferase